jgi:ATP-dependent RNA helicase SUPV3L1/SUV3
MENYIYFDQFPLARSIKRQFIFHCGDTNSGKTYEALEELKKADKGVYLAPLRLMALENADILNDLGLPCNMITGEERILKEGARFVSSTIEMMDTNEIYDVAIIDEVQMLLDEKRGGFWTKALFGLAAKKIYLTGTEDAIPLLEKMFSIINENFIIKKFERKTKLTPINELISVKLIKKNDAIIAFSKVKVLELKTLLRSKGIKASVVYGNLSPELRRLEAEKFRTGVTDVLISTDAIGMGLNLPIQRVLFSSIQKFDGVSLRKLYSHEIKQIIGRAGRYGIFPEGKYGVLLDDYTEHSDIKTLDACIKNNKQYFTNKFPITIDKNMILTFQKKDNNDSASIFNAVKEISEHFLSYDKENSYVQNISNHYHLLTSFIVNKIPSQYQLDYLFFPVDYTNSNLMGYFLNWVKNHMKNEVNKFPELKLPDKKFTQDNLEILEQHYKICNLYNSISYKFPDFYPDIEPSSHLKTQINLKISSYLTQKFEKRYKVNYNEYW